jgi:hypothetical protein
MYQIEAKLIRDYLQSIVILVAHHLVTSQDYAVNFLFRFIIRCGANPRLLSKPNIVAHHLDPSQD